MSERVAPAQEYHKLAAAAGLQKPPCRGLNLGLNVDVPTEQLLEIVAKVRAAFAAGAAGKKKLNKREQKDARGPRPII